MINQNILEEITKRLIITARKVGLRINAEKSRYMRIGTVGEVDTLRTETELQGLVFREVKEYIHLRVREWRLTKDNKCAGAMNCWIRSKDLSNNTKLRVYKTILRSTTLYGCESWVLNKNAQNKLLIWERIILRRIFGGKKTEDGYERRTNTEIYNLYREKNLARKLCQKIEQSSISHGESQTAQKNEEDQ